MSSILEELWYGNIAPNDGSGRMSAEARRLLKKVADSHDKLYEALSEEQKELLESFNDACADLSDTTEREIFVYAFRLGAKIALEVSNPDI